MSQPWAYRLPTTPLDNGSIGGYITDAQSRLNVNNLTGGGTAATAAQAALQRLFAELSVPNPLLNAITDWVDADNQTTPNGGAEDGYYLAQDPPGLAANAPVRRVAELLAVRGADPTLIARLTPFVDALDAPTTVNVNTAPAEVLVAAVGGLDAAGAAAVVSRRATAPFTSLGDFRGRLQRPNLSIDETMLSVTSDWFVVTIAAQQGDTVARARALLRRSATAGAWPYVVWQTVE